MLLIGKVCRRFVPDEDGDVKELEVLCLKPKIGLGTILEDVLEEQRKFDKDGRNPFA